MVLLQVENRDLGCDWRESGECLAFDRSLNDKEKDSVIVLLTKSNCRLRQECATLREQATLLGKG